MTCHACFPVLSSVLNFLPSALQGFTEVQFKKLFNNADHDICDEDSVLINRAEQFSELYLLVSGTMRVVMNDNIIGFLTEGSFIGEVEWRPGIAMFMKQLLLSCKRMKPSTALLLTVRLCALQLQEQFFNPEMKANATATLICGEGSEIVRWNTHDLNTFLGHQPTIRSVLTMTLARYGTALTIFREENQYDFRRICAGRT